MNYVARVIASAAVCTALIGAVAVNAAHHGEAKEMATPSIVEIAGSNADFSTLVTALQAAGLVDALSGDGPFTVFAPTNAAFAKLPAGTVETLLKPENKDKLTAILTYHVVPGKVTAAEVVKLSEATTLEGDTVAISVSDAGVKVDEATVVTTDIMGSNGVIHVIDSVIMPNS